MGGGGEMEKFSKSEPRAVRARIVYLMYSVLQESKHTFPIFATAKKRAPILHLCI